MRRKRGRSVAPYSPPDRELMKMRMGEWSEGMVRFQRRCSGDLRRSMYRLMSELCDYGGPQRRHGVHLLEIGNEFRRAATTNH